MARVGTHFELDDRSDIPALNQTPDNILKPVFPIAFSSDKGREEPIFVTGKTFFDMFGYNINFEKHGQPLLQAAYAINSGAMLYAKRVVAPDSTLAHICVTAQIEKKQTQKKNADGKLLYKNALGEETIEATEVDGITANAPIMIDSADLSFKLTAVNDIEGNNPTEIVSEFLKAIPENTDSKKSFPLFVLFDTGRGASKKKFKISSNYQTSRNYEHAIYTFELLENNSQLEAMSFTFNPDIIYRNNNISLKNVIERNSKQVRCTQFETSFSEMAEFIGTILDYDSAQIADLKLQDLIFGKTYKGKTIPGIVVSGEINLSNIYGISLEKGSNGVFGDAPFGKAEYETAVEEFFDGTYSDSIYDVDNVRMDVILDANYPEKVKRAIEALVTFREDVMFFRDLGIDKRSLDEILLADEKGLKNLYIATYCNSWDIIDPYSRKQISVTACYSIVRPLVNHFINGRSRAFAGIKFGVTFPEVVEGTINFNPKITPKADQKTLISDARINYATYYDNLLVMETLYTSQERYTQLSFINNVLVTQEVVKDIRLTCPKIRYSFADGDELKRYKEDVEVVINRHANKFKNITMEYAEDPTQIQNKVFYAIIYVQFRDFFQTEYFKIVALPSYN